MPLDERIWVLSSLCVGFLVGSVAAEALPWVTIWPALSIGFGAVLFLVWPKPTARVLVIGLIGVILGVMRWDNAFQTWNTSPPMKTVLHVQGWLEQPLQTITQGERGVVQVLDLHNGDSMVHLTGATRIVVTFPYGTHINYGDELTFDAKLGFLPKFDSFDGERYWRVRGVEAAATVKTVTVDRQDKGNWIVHQMYALRQITEHRVRAVLPGPEGLLLLGLLFGSAGQLPKAIADQFRILGISHLTAVSGYNLTIISLWPVALAGLIPKRTSLALAAILVGLFVIFTGAPSSIVRAAMMAWVVLVGKRIGRAPHSILLILFTACLMAIYNPFVVKDDAGFVLSFLAFFGLIEIGPMLSRLLRRIRLDGMRTIVSETLGAQIATLPYLLGAFGQLSVVAPIANVIILPLIPALMLVGLTVVVLNLIPFALFRVWLELLYYPLHGFLWLIDRAAHLPFASIAWPRGGYFPWFLAIVLLVWWASKKRHPSQILPNSAPVDRIQTPSG